MNKQFLCLSAADIHGNITQYEKIRKLVVENNIAFVFLCGEAVRLPLPDQDLYVAGYPYIGMTPFLHKDWEKWDLEPGNIPYKLYRTVW